jgi:hypothetical protein
MKKLYTCLLSVLLGVLVILGAISLFDRDKTVSLVENRKLASKPVFSWSALFKGTYIQNLETYYADTFPFRDNLLSVNKKLNRFYYYSGGNDNYLAISYNGGAEKGGEALHTAEQAASEAAGETTTAAGETTASAAASETSSAETTTATETEKPDPEIALPGENQATAIGTIIVVGDNAMDIPTATYSVIDKYAAAVNDLAAAMGSGVQTYSLVTPNSGEFYSPESFHTGSHSQKDMIEYCYGKMDESVKTVDAYSALREHADEYLFFRTDHHWTALGAYYAYTAFCKSAGFEAVPLSDFQTGTYENFLGSMYTYTSGYAQSDALKKHPDTLTYYLPIHETHAKYYADTTLTNGVAVSVVYTKLSDSVSNKYLCFIGGDTPICVIDTDVGNGKTCMVLKESYGNAFIPFLTSHYSKIIVVDPREFNHGSKPKLNVAAFGKSQGVNDLIVINYPFMINNTSYIDWLERLVK